MNDPAEYFALRIKSRPGQWIGDDGSGTGIALTPIVWQDAEQALDFIRHDTLLTREEEALTVTAIPPLSRTESDARFEVVYFREVRPGDADAVKAVTKAARRMFDEGHLDHDGHYRVHTKDLNVLLAALLPAEDSVKDKP